MHQRRRLSLPVTDWQQVYLAMEERESEAVAMAETLISRWARCFLRIDFTLHPVGIPGEAPGKSSNESWAAKQIVRDFGAHGEAERVIVTIMDGR